MNVKFQGDKPVRSLVEMEHRLELLNCLANTEQEFLKDALRESDLIIHCGDIGDPAVLEALRKLAPVRAIRGNNDKGAWASSLPTCDVVEVGTHVIYVLHNLSELDLDPLTSMI